MWNCQLLARIYIIITILGLVLYAPPVFAHAGSDDKRTTGTASSSPMMQNEMAVAVNPTNLNNTVVAYNDFSPLPSNCPRPHYSYSIDGGNTWTVGTALPTTGLAVLSCGGLTGTYCCDPVLAFDSSGTAYLATMTFGTQILLYYSPEDGSGNAGITWSGPVVVAAPSGAPNTASIDKPAIAIDRTGGAFGGNIYVAWVDYFTAPGALSLCNMVTFSNCNDRIMVRTATLVGGVPTFSSAAVRASEAPSTAPYNWGPAVEVAPDGSLYVGYLRLTSGGISTVNSIRMSRSDDGGASFPLQGQTIASGVSGPTAPASSRASAIPTIAIASDETLVVAWTDRRYGDMDILSARSTTQGSSWSSIIQVNNDKAPGASNGKDQFLPAAALADDVLHIFFYDRRSDPSNINGWLYAAKSTDKGVSYPSNFAVSDTFSNPNVCSSGWRPCLWGDYLDADAQPSGITGRFYVAWADGRDGTAGSNDVNVYFESFTSLNILPYWAWEIFARPILPYNICIVRPIVCLEVAEIVILPVDGFQGLVAFSVKSAPRGVSVGFEPVEGIPPFTARMMITVDPQNASCTTEQCINDIVLEAAAGDGTKTMTLPLTLSNIPFLTLDSSVYSPSDTMMVTGEGFTPNSQVSLTVDTDTTVLANPQTDDNGTFQTQIQVPTSLPSGQHTLTGRDTQNEVGTADFISPRVEIESEFGVPPPVTPVPAFSPMAALVITVLTGLLAGQISRVRRIRRVSL